MKDFQRQRAEGAAELARATLRANNVAEGTTELLTVLDRFVPSIGKAIGLARSRDGDMEYVAVSGTLEPLRGHKPHDALGLVDLEPERGGRILPNLGDAAASDLEPPLPAEWGFVVPLFVRDRLLGVLLVSAPPSAPLVSRDRVTLERLSTSLALALDALVLDEHEQMARDRAQLLATAVTTIDHPILILDHTHIRFANPAAAREYGWSQAELLDQPFEDLVIRVVPRMSPRIGDDQDSDGVSLMQHVHRRRDGTEFPAAVTMSTLFAPDGESLGQVVSVRNMTADRALEVQLRQTEKMVALGELVAGVAHEINNPLTGISVFAQLLLEEPLSDDHRESVQLIKQECDRATGVIRDLLVFARKTEPDIGPVDVNALLQQSLRLHAYPLRSAGITVHFQPDPANPHMLGDLPRLQQVMINLLRNAEQAMAQTERRELTVTTTTHPGFVRITIADSGQGMSDDVRQRMFEPFFSTKSTGIGVGLGMSTSYGIIHAFGGRIEVDSAVNQGTTITLHLPIADGT